MDKKALQLAARFALPPNSLGYCGKDTAPAKFIECVIGGKCGGVKKEMEKFIVLNPYLETLKEVTGLPKFDYKNVEAYWLGNGELEKANLKHYQLLLENFSKQGVPEWLVTELQEKLPKQFIPFHLFQVLHVGVGRASGSVPYNLETINNCMVRWGTIQKFSNYHLTINICHLSKKNKRYEITWSEEKFEYRGDFLGKVKVGNMVAVHWKQVVKKLTKKEVGNLELWTERTIEVCGSELNETAQKKDNK
jgi:hypothetical protein